MVIKKEHISNFTQVGTTLTSSSSKGSSRTVVIREVGVLHEVTLLLLLFREAVEVAPSRPLPPPLRHLEAAAVVVDGFVAAVGNGANVLPLEDSVGLSKAAKGVVEWQLTRPFSWPTCSIFSSDLRVPPTFWVQWRTIENRQGPVYDMK